MKKAKEVISNRKPRLKASSTNVLANTSSDQPEEKEDLYITQSDKQESDKMSNSDASFQSRNNLNASSSTCDEEDDKMGLVNFQWFHGFVLNEQVTPLLKWNNSFCVRRSVTNEGKKTICLTVRQKDEFNNYAIVHENGGWTSHKLFESVGQKPKYFPRIYNFIDYWSLHGETCIPIPRPSNIINQDNVKLDAKLGSGAFGEVWKCSFKINGIVKECAAKLAKGEVTKNSLKEFYAESRILSILDHDCVIRYYGICSISLPIMILMEFASLGTVRSYVQNNKQLNNDTLISFIFDAAKGMAHLSSRKVIHRDLAARNCLLSADLSLKISDFGLSVRGNDVKVKSLKRAPIRWLSPETLNKGIFNEKTDVWTYGVTLWEIFTKCAKPPLYRKTTKLAMEEIKTTEHPHKLPKIVSPDVVDILNKCTEKSPDERPRFKMIVMTISNLIDKKKEAKMKDFPKKFSQRKEGTLTKKKSGIFFFRN